MLTIDGIVFSLQRQGGISVYFHHLLRYLSDKRVAATCLLEDPLQQEIGAPSGAVRMGHRNARVVERYRSCRTPADTTLFHSSYYRLPDRGNPVSVLTVYDFVYERWQSGPRLWVHRAQKNRAIRAAQAVICISQSTKDDLLEFVGERSGQQIHVIHCGISDVFRDLHLDPPERPYVLFVGQRGGYKNFRQVVEAMAFLPDHALHCVGGGPIRPDELTGIPEAVAKRIRHLGFVSDEELNLLYGRAQCLAYPSRYEGFGIPVLEAMRAGCPVVCTDCKAVLEVGKGALTVVRDPDPRAMADAIRTTATAARLRLKQTGSQIAESYSWDTAHRQTLAVYRSLGVDF